MPLVQDKPEPTVVAGLGTTLVKVDEYLGMAQSSTASITGYLQHGSDDWPVPPLHHEATHHPLGDHSRRDGSDHVYGPLSVDLLVQASHSKPCTALVRLLKLLPSVGGLVRLGHREGEGAGGGQLETGLHRPGADQASERHLETSIVIDEVIQRIQINLNSE